MSWMIPWTCWVVDYFSEFGKWGEVENFNMKGFFEDPTLGFSEGVCQAYRGCELRCSIMGAFELYRGWGGQFDAQFCGVVLFEQLVLPSGFIVRLVVRIHPW
ncbi:hypothetical protein VNO78_13576 [Psophocarpus tetragonolobus]|uniref:Uncharacterized protein n=1 Tax=Psophocarpus tetragonolobus TaxID=3891 RepID=A0AAN9SPB5_PSOTE